MSTNMFTKCKEHSIASLGEVALINKIGQWLGSVSPSSPRGMGDDCALHTPLASEKQLLTTDSLTYGLHFDDTVSPENAGAKLLKRNLSDIAAMGGKPGPALLNLLCGPDLTLDWLERFIQGLHGYCVTYNVDIVGGDVSALQCGQFSAVLTQTGSALLPLLRGGARSGDSIYVTGSLGGSITGKHYLFKPRLAEGQWLVESGNCSALMDLTDGLAKDLPALLPKSSAAWIDLTRIPLSDETSSLQGDPLERAFTDGEDYELLFALKAGTHLADFETAWRQQFPDTALSRIGRIGSQVGDALLVNATTQTALPWQRGFEHLSGQ